MQYGVVQYPTVPTGNISMKSPSKPKTMTLDEGLLQPLTLEKGVVVAYCLSVTGHSKQHLARCTVKVKT